MIKDLLEEYKEKVAMIIEASFIENVLNIMWINAYVTFIKGFLTVASNVCNGQEIPLT